MHTVNMVEQSFDNHTHKSTIAINRSTVRNDNENCINTIHIIFIICFFRPTPKAKFPVKNIIAKKNNSKKI